MQPSEALLNRIIKRGLRKLRKKAIARPTASSLCHKLKWETAVPETFDSVPTETESQTESQTLEPFDENTVWWSEDD